MSAAAIQINKRVLLRGRAQAVVLSHRILSHPDPPRLSRWSSYSGWRLSFFPRPNMTIDKQNHARFFGFAQLPAWSKVWHLWKVLIPRRSITGRLVHGTVWRRHDGRHWIYKKFTDVDGFGAP